MLTTYRITFDNGQTITTSMAKNVTLEDAQKYYLGNEFELIEGQPNVKAVNVEKV